MPQTMFSPSNCYHMHYCLLHTVATNLIAETCPTNQKATTTAKSFMDIFAPLTHPTRIFLNNRILPDVYFDDNRNSIKPAYFLHGSGWGKN